MLEEPVVLTQMLRRYGNVRSTGQIVAVRSLPDWPKARTDVGCE
jgi:hypothetical protein